VWLNTDVPVRVDRGAGSERELVVFTLHGEQYGVPIETVREIVQYRRPSATATAVAGGLIQGLISLRGEVLPVADLSSRLGREPHSGEGAQIVVLALAEGSLGLIVDHVEGVRRVPDEQISPSPVPGAEAGFGDEIAAIDDVLVLLLDPQVVLDGVLRGPAAKRSTVLTPAAARTPTARKPAAARKPPAKKPAPAKPKKPAAAKPEKPAAAKPKKPAAARRPPAKKPAAAKPKKTASTSRSQATRQPPSS
jgi:purine-binding chemotaxis protein CheW